MTVVRQPPLTDPIDLVLTVVGDAAVRARRGSVLVLVPSSGWAERLTGRLLRRGCPTATTWEQARAGWPVVVGSRAAAWSPVPRLAAVVLLDAHDAAYREESAPTYSALDVLMERARRDDAPCVVASPVPPVALAAGTDLRTVAPSRPAGACGLAGPRTGRPPGRRPAQRHVLRRVRPLGPLGPRRVSGARSTDRWSASTTGRAGPGSWPAATAGSWRGARGAGRPQPSRAARTVLRCPRCDQTRPVVCAACGRLRMKTLRAGVSRLREELAALLGAEVGEVTGPRSAADETAVPDAPVLIGTEAVLHRVRRAAAVAFLDIDLHLLAPRLSAAEETMALFVRAARLVGARGAGPPWSRMQAQTRVPEHPLLRAVALGEPTEVLAEEVGIRRMSALPPFAALAVVSGALAPAYAEALGQDAATSDATATDGVSLAALGDDRFLLRADTHGPLCDLLARTPRPSGRGLRVEVDPVSL